MSISVPAIENTFQNSQVLLTLDDICAHVDDDDYVDDVKFLIGMHWKNIKSDLLSANPWIYMSLTPLGCAYYLPSIMVASIMDLEKVKYTLLNCLCRFKCQNLPIFISHLNKLLQSFTDEQLNLIRIWLKWLCETSGCDEIISEAEIALQNIARYENNMDPQGKRSIDGR